MTIAANATDQQIGEILTSLQAVAPDVIEQAVRYGQIGGAVGMLSFGTVALICMVVVAMVIRDMFRTNYSDWGVCGVIAGVVGAATLFFCLVCADTWAQATYTPDYYAARCIGRLIK